MSSNEKELPQKSKENRKKRSSEKICTFCGIDCKSDYQRIRHERTHTGEKPFKCELCEFASSQKSGIEQHMVVHSDVKPLMVKIKCTLCDQMINKKHIRRHEKTVHAEKKSYKCHLCDYRSTYQHLITVHLKIHSDEKPFACDVCDYRTHGSYRLKSHMVMHSENKEELKKMKCRFCDYRCFQQCQMKTHERQHTGEKPFECDQCDYRAASQTTLACHLKLHKGEKPVACSFCDFRCTGQYALKRHMLAHSDDRPFACNDCDYRAKRIRDLRDHVKSCHDKPFWCEQCSETFTKEFLLHEHLRWHDGELPYSCEQCNKKLATEEQLKTHLVTHFGNFKCKYCGVSFIHKSYRAKHARSHLDADGNVQYKCEDCEKEFQNGPDYAAHYMEHYNQRPFKCTVCDRKFRVNRALSSHFLLMHQGNRIKKTIITTTSDNEPLTQTNFSIFEKKNSATKQKSEVDKQRKLLLQSASTECVLNTFNVPENAITITRTAEHSVLPLSVCLYRKICLEKEMVFVWLEKIEPDVLPFVRTHPSKCSVFCLQGTIPARCKHLKLKMTSFCVRSSTTKSTQWNLFTVGATGSYNILKEKQFDSYNEIETLFGNSNNVVNVVRYPYISSGTFHTIERQFHNVTICNSLTN